jgi:hypothetical protein
MISALAVARKREHWKTGNLTLNSKGGPMLHTRFAVPIAMLLIVGARGVFLWSQNTAPKGFSLTKVTRFISYEGKPDSQFVEKIASRSDGAFAVETFDALGSLRRFTVPARKVRYLIEPKLKVKSTLRITDQDIVNKFTDRTYSGDNCVAHAPAESVHVGNSSYAGHATAVFKWGFNRERNEYLHTAEFAPALNCFQLKAEHLWMKDGKLVSKTVEEAKDVVLSNSDSPLFEDPAHYPELEPSVLKQRHYYPDSAGLVPQCLRNAWKRADGYYAKALAGEVKGD